MDEIESALFNEYKEGLIKGHLNGFSHCYNLMMEKLNTLVPNSLANHEDELKLMYEFELLRLEQFFKNQFGKNL